MKVLVLGSLVGCVYGGGPTLGYGQHGWIAGVEAGGGFALILPQGTVGYEIHHARFSLRVDETYDRVQKRSAVDGRIGGGISVSTTGDLGGVFVLGPSYGALVGTEASCGQWNTELRFELQLRYASEWQLVFAPRAERVSWLCN